MHRPIGEIAGRGLGFIANRFRGQVALVTGAASGMGRAQALRLAAEGASVAVIDKDEDGGRETVELIERGGGTARFLLADLSRQGDVDAVIAAARERFGPPNLLLSNAGVVLVKAYTETTEDDFDRVMAVNVKSAFMITRRVIPQMIENGGGSIVLMSSVSAGRGFPFEAIYGVSKAAIESLMLNITVEFRERGIRCNAVSPAFVRTPHGMNEIRDFQALGIDWSDDDLAATQLRICEPEEVSNVALFLASSDAAFVNGVSVNVDNGWMAKA